MPKISVLMSVFNEERYIESSIKSILEQDFLDFELLIADDGSSDKTLVNIKKIEDKRITVIQKENTGKADTLNQLIKIAKGDYLVIQDSDDLSEPDRLTVLFDEMKKNEDVCLLLSGHSLIINEKIVAPKGRNISSQECNELVSKLKLPAHDPTMIVKTKIAREIMFDTKLRIGQGVDFIFRVAEKYKMKVIRQPLYNYRIHTNSITKNNVEKKVTNLLNVMNKAKIRRGESTLSKDEFVRDNSRWVYDKFNNLSGHFMESAYYSVMDGNRVIALNTALTSLKYVKHGRKYIFPVLYALSPKIVCTLGKKYFGSR